MALSLGPIVVVFTLISFGLLNSSPLDFCPDFCTCTHSSHLNCSSSGISLVPQNIRTSVAELDLSNNQLEALTLKSKYYNLQKLWLGNNSVTHLSFCVNSDSTKWGTSRIRRSPGPLRRRRCLIWAPTLQLLSAERNQLQILPEGLEQLRALQILNLSFNKISKLEQGDFAHLNQLEELLLHHNLITILQPQTFEKLHKLKVLDLSFNLLTTLHPSTYASLRGFGTDVALWGNSWICDCGMRFLRKMMTVDSKRGLKTSSIECSSPLAHSGMNLLELQEEDLECPESDNSRQLRKEVTVHRGSRILLTCFEPDAVWWTPNGQAIRSQDKEDLLLKDITEQDEGLYVCMSPSHQTVSIFNVQIHQKSRKSRSIPEEIPHSLEKMNQTRNTVTQSHFDMAVSLSVIITFIVAFILGVLLQPYICICWQKIKSGKQKPQPTTTVPNAQQEQYDNEAYLHCEDIDDFEPHRERRVTFTEYTEEGNMQYYDTVAGDVQEVNGVVNGPGPARSNSSDESGSDDDMRNHKNANNLGKKIKFEHISDSVKRNSLSSQSSMEDRILKNNCSTPNRSLTTEEQVQRTEIRNIEVTHISVESQNEIPGFTSEPFADWSPHQHGSSLMNPDLDNGDQFEFSDSVRSGSPVSPHSLNGSFRQPNFLVPNVNKNRSSSSSSSAISDGEPTHYTVNADSEEEAEVFKKAVGTNQISQIARSSSSSDNSDSESHHAVEAWPVVDLEHIPTIKRRLIFTTMFNESYRTEIAVINQVQREGQILTIIEQKPSMVKKRKAPLPPPRKASSSSSESEDENRTLTQENLQLVTNQETKYISFEEPPSWPIINLEHVARVKRRLDIKKQYAGSESFSSSDNEDERIYEEIKEQQGLKIPIYSKQETSVATTDIKTQSGTSSSSESEDEQEHLYENVQLVTCPNVKLEQESHWPVINLVKIPKVKRRLDFKTTAPTVDTSLRRDSEDEQLYVNVTQVQGKVPLGVINVSKPSSRTSSSSESEDEREIKVKYIQENLQQTTSPIKPPTAVNLEASQWPVIDLIRIPKVKRRLDIKQRIYSKVTQVPERVPSTSVSLPYLESGTSSSSESDDENKFEMMNKETVQHVTPASKRPAPKSPWPVIDLARIPKVKRRLDITEKVNLKATQVPARVPSTIVTTCKSDSGTSSSSESEDEKEFEMVNKETVQHIAPTSKQPAPKSPWPVIDLVRIPKVKRRLDIKERVHLKATQVPARVPSTIITTSKPDSGTSSSSESEDEEIKVVEHLQLTTSTLSPPTAVKPNQWPVIDLVKVPKVKKRLDIKRVVPFSESSSSDSEDERVQVNLTQVTGKIPSRPVSVQKPDSRTSSSSESEDEKEFEMVNKETVQHIAPTSKRPAPKSPWPVIDLARIPKVKCRLDIKERVNLKETQVPARIPPTIVTTSKPDSGTSSSSESEDEEIKVVEHLQLTTSTLSPPTAVKPNQWPVIDLVKVPKVKQRLDIKRAVPFSESSSSDSEDERVQVNLTQVTGKIPSRPVSVQKPVYGSSSSSESEDEQKITTGNLHQIATTAKQPITESTWPVIDLARIPKVKRRLDIKKIINVKVAPDRALSTSIKVPEPYSRTSSSSDSEDEGEIKIANMENQQQVAPVTKPTAEPLWPLIELSRLPKVKRRLDIKERVNIKVAQLPERVPSTGTKVPTSDSGTSSSSEDEDERQQKEKVQIVITPNRQPTESQWPVVDLVNVPKVKRRLDIKERTNIKVAQVPQREPSGIKVSKQESQTSSSSESEDEQNVKIVTKENLQISPSGIQPTDEWPVLDLVRIPKMKRRLDIKENVYEKVTLVPERVPSTTVRIPKPESGTSSSSESEEERDIKVRESLQQSTSPINPPAALKPSPWPVIDFVKVPKVKRRLDIKTTVPASDSSSSDSEDERVQVNVTQVLIKHPSTPVTVQKLDSGTSSSSESEDEQGIKVKVDQENLQQTVSPINQSTSIKNHESPWSVINLINIPKVKRRLDIKPAATGGSISDSEDEKMQINVQGNLISTPVNVQKPDSGTSSSSESEDEHKIITGNLQQTAPTSKQPNIETQWPVIDIVRIPKVKRRLDIKERENVTVAPERVPSIKVPQYDPGTSSSSESEGEEQIKIVNKENLHVVPATKQPTAESPWPVVDLVRIPKLKQRLDIKEKVKVPQVQQRVPSTSVKVHKPESGTSSSSESEDEEKAPSIKSETTQWPIVDFQGVTRIKRRLDFKIPFPSSPTAKDHKSSSSSSDEEGNTVKISQISVRQTSIGLDVKRPSIHESSSHSSDDENDKPTFSGGSVKSQDKGFIKVSPILNITHSPTKPSPNIELEKYNVITDNSRGNVPSPVVTSELQSKWATMNLGVSRFRKRLDITRTSNSSSPPPNSPKQDILFTGFDMPQTKSVIVTEQAAVEPTTKQNKDNSSSSNSESENDLKLEGKSSKVVGDFVSPQISLSSIPKIKQSLNITAVQKKSSSSSSSSSDEETGNIMMPDLRAGIPRVKRRLNIKAPTPPSSSSSSDEKVYAHNFSDVTDQRSIEYKRTIMKSSSYDSSTRWQQSEPLYVKGTTRTPPKLTLDNIKRKLLPSKQNELPPNLRWTSVGSHLSEHPIPVSKRQQDGYMSPPPISSPPLTPKHDSSDSSSSDDDQREAKTTMIVTQKTYNPRSVTFKTSPTMFNVTYSEERTARRGLSALKAMSSDRKNWESDYEIITESAPVSVDHLPEVQSTYWRTVNTETKMSQATSYSVSTSSPATEERQLANMMYGIPSYKRHIIKSAEPPESLPPPVPSTPLPEDTPDFTWKSPTSSLNRGNVGYYRVQQKTTVEESVDEPFHDNPNISAV